MKFEGIEKKERREGQIDFENRKNRIKDEIKNRLIFFGCNLDDDKCIQGWLDNLSPSFDHTFDEACVSNEGLLDNWDIGGEEERKNILNFFKKELKV